MISPQQHCHHMFPGKSKTDVAKRVPDILVVLPSFKLFPNFGHFALDGHYLTSSMVAFSTLSSIEDSPPSSPTFGPAPNFAEVAPGIYRSSFPHARNFDHLKSLKLTSIL